MRLGPILRLDELQTGDLTVVTELESKNVAAGKSLVWINLVSKLPYRHDQTVNASAASVASTSQSLPLAATRPASRSAEVLQPGLEEVGRYSRIDLLSPIISARATAVLSFGRRLH